MCRNSFIPNREDRARVFQTHPERNLMDCSLPSHYMERIHTLCNSVRIIFSFFIIKIKFLCLPWASNMVVNNTSIVLSLYSPEFQRVIFNVSGSIVHIKFLRQIVSQLSDAWTLKEILSTEPKAFKTYEMQWDESVQNQKKTYIYSSWFIWLIYSMCSGL